MAHALAHPARAPLAALCTGCRGGRRCVQHGLCRVHAARGAAGAHPRRVFAGAAGAAGRGWVVQHAAGDAQCRGVSSHGVSGPGRQAAGHCLRYIGDNRGSIAALDRQTGCAAVFTVVKRLLLYCHARGVDLEFEWRPRTDAQVAYADSLSRFTDWSAVFFTKATYQFVCKVMGKHPNLDLFAGSGAKEHHTAQYFTVSHCPGTSGVDAFAQDWRLTPQGLPAFVWAFPPVWQIAACLRRFAQDRVSGLLVVPVGMKFWRPLLDRLPVKQRLSLPPHPGQYWLGSQAPAAWRGQPPLLFEVYKVEFI